ncbi:MAG: hypothetical protein BEN19_04860 [Epulopiscium sp. Nuni2H_MBin003]|nr:MAG: hypothetical protein BEN19_04860 [Epulopiscium sp. Nuni2H_MBin003]
MEKILRKKFITFSVSIVFIVLFTLLVFINGINYINIIKIRTDRNIDAAILNYTPSNITAPPPPNNMPILAGDAIKRAIPYYFEQFVVEFDMEYNITHVDMSKCHFTDRVEAIQYANKLIGEDAGKGFINNYKYAIVKTPDLIRMHFIDCTAEFSMSYNAFINSLMVFFMAFIAISGLITLLSKRAVSVIVKGYERQKEFITGVTHELKTPLTIIKGSVEVLEIQNGASTWTSSIVEQINKLTKLIDYLISLTKLEENNIINKTNFCLSELIIESCMFFEIVATTNNKTLDYEDIQTDLYYKGDMQNIELLISILLENALKYSIENTILNISLKLINNKYILVVTNSAEDLEIKQYDEWFERFYRMDKSRNTSGFGIGLSMAKAIVTSHKGKITAESQDGKNVIIKVILPIL